MKTCTINGHTYRCKTAQGGYKAMLRDRVPRTVDLALKWCKAKDRWVEYVYYTHIWWIKEKEAREHQTKYLLALTKNNREFKFENTIEWNDLSEEERKYWESVQSWVSWFSIQLLPMVDSYKLHLMQGDSPEYIQLCMTEKYLKGISEQQQEKLYKHIVNHIIQYYV